MLSHMSKENLRVILEHDVWDIHNNLHKKQGKTTGHWHGRMKCSNCGYWNDHDFIFCKHWEKQLKQD